MTADDEKMRRRAEREIQEDIDRLDSFFAEHPYLARLGAVAILGYFAILVVMLVLWVV